jgi:predicted nicotinamide N-methyase
MGRPHPLLSKNTELGSPPLVPELKLHLATDATELWKMTTKELKDNSFPLAILGVCMGRRANFSTRHFR